MTWFRFFVAGFALFRNVPFLTRFSPYPKYGVLVFLRHPPHLLHTSPPLLPHSLPDITHTDITHIDITDTDMTDTHTQISHTQMSHTQISHTQISHTYIHITYTDITHIHTETDLCGFGVGSWHPREVLQEARRFHLGRESDSRPGLA